MTEMLHRRLQSITTMSTMLMTIHIAKWFPSFFLEKPSDGARSSCSTPSGSQSLPLLPLILIDNSTLFTVKVCVCGAVGGAHQHRHQIVCPGHHLSTAGCKKVPPPQPFTLFTTISTWVWADSTYCSLKWLGSPLSPASWPTPSSAASSTSAVSWKWVCLKSPKKANATKRLEASNSQDMRSSSPTWVAVRPPDTPPGTPPSTPALFSAVRDPQLPCFATSQYLLDHVIIIIHTWESSHPWRDWHSPDPIRVSTCLVLQDASWIITNCHLLPVTFSWF